MSPPARSRAVPRLGLLALLPTLLTPACVTVTESYRDPRDFAPRKTDDVLVVEERPARPYIVIASLEAEGEGRTYSRDELVAMLRRKAAHLGGDALLLYGDANTGMFLSAGVLIGSAPTVRQRHVLADVVVFTDRGEAPR